MIPALILLLGGTTIIKLLYGNDFLMGITALNILLMGNLCNVGFGSVAALLNMSGRQSTTVKVMLFSVLVNLILNITLVPHVRGLMELQ